MHGDMTKKMEDWVELEIHPTQECGDRPQIH